MRGLNILYYMFHNGGIEQVGCMQTASLDHTRAGRHRVHFIAATQQRLDGMTANKTPSACEQNALNYRPQGLTRKSGYDVSLSDTTGSCTGHSIPNAGSFHRTPSLNPGV